MKKFVGLVNGETFDNEKDFNDAAKKAIKENDGNLSISSYYSYSSDNVLEDGKNDDDKKQLATDVLTEEYVLNESAKPDVTKPGRLVYYLSNSLRERLQNATNKEYIRNVVDETLTAMNDELPYYETKSKQLERQIEETQNKLYENENELNTLKAKIEYYESIGKLVKEREDTKKENNEDHNYYLPRRRAVDVLGLNDDATVYDFLRLLGFFR